MPDLPDNATATAKVSVGDCFWDRLEVASDRDWIALDAAAGDRVSINTMGYGRGNLNQGIFTTMSYNSGYFTGTGGSAPYYGLTDYGYDAGPMALDIAVLQELYGAGAGYKGGSTTYSLPENNQSGTYWQAIWDTGGSDEIRYDGSGRANIDLRAATLNDNFGGAQDDWISGGRVAIYCLVGAALTHSISALFFIAIKVQHSAIPSRILAATVIRM